MPDLILRTQLSSGQIVAQPLSEITALAVEAGATYTIVDATTQETPVGLVFDRREEDLEIELDGETLVVIDDFYAADSAASFSADGSFTQAADLVSGDLPAVSAVGSLEAADVSAGILPAGATLNPATWGWAGVAGAAGAVGAAGLGTGLGLGLDNDKDPGIDTSVVVFDLAEDGDSSDHSGQTFSDSVSYTIYVVVDSASGLVDLDPAEQWSGVSNLGTDDVIVLVGTGSPVQVGNGNSLTTMYTEGAIEWTGPGYGRMSLQDWGLLRRYESDTTSGPPTSFAARIHTTSSFTTYTTYSAHLWTETSWGSSSNPNADNSFSQAYLTTMPAGIMTSQGLQGLV